jgi:hypothetical protein
MAKGKNVTESIQTAEALYEDIEKLAHEAPQNDELLDSKVHAAYFTLRAHEAANESAGAF